PRGRAVLPSVGGPEQVGSPVRPLTDWRAPKVLDDEELRPALRALTDVEAEALDEKVRRGEELSQEERRGRRGRRRRRPRRGARRAARAEAGAALDAAGGRAGAGPAGRGGGPAHAAGPAGGVLP